MEKGYCERRETLTIRLAQKPPNMPMPLTPLERKCLYECQGYDITCKSYTPYRGGEEGDKMHGS